MPRCGSQVVLCDVPIRYDTYEGCGHICRYCFAYRKRDVAKISDGESAESLRKFIEGKRGSDTAWCDWNIPLHWGGMSDPFQPIERTHKRSLEALKVFAETKYPFIVSTKGTLLKEPEYLALISQCNAVLQVSMVCSKYDQLEKGASTFEERLEMIRIVAPHVKRVIVRIQPYMTSVFKDVLKNLQRFKDAGVYGIIVEGMKFPQKIDGLVKVEGDYCYPAAKLRQQFEVIRDTAHNVGLKFYSGENRLRAMGDSLCCCGIDGLEGFEPNTYNMNHYLYDPENFVPRPHMQEPGTAGCYGSLHQDTNSHRVIREKSFAYYMGGAITKDKGIIDGLTDKK